MSPWDAEATAEKNYTQMRCPAMSQLWAAPLTPVNRQPPLRPLLSSRPEEAYCSEEHPDHQSDQDWERDAVYLLPCRGHGACPPPTPLVDV